MEVAGWSLGDIARDTVFDCVVAYFAAVKSESGLLDGLIGDERQRHGRAAPVVAWPPVAPRGVDLCDALFVGEMGNRTFAISHLWTPGPDRNRRCNDGQAAAAQLLLSREHSSSECCHLITEHVY
ncbi:hypothetical protein [Mycolicibacterium llatzerense]|uniref:hypothetical protein n=1 Tax=Mycolicibacterium llatzerense TaxID=280871 RepID=UPI0021B6C63F|nr:hypothetical protein [Mycolicibacterium llatzerense]